MNFYRVLATKPLEGRVLCLHKVQSLLEAFLDLISGSSLQMKIQIMGGKITENLGFKTAPESKV